MVATRAGSSGPSLTQTGSRWARCKSGTWSSLSRPRIDRRQGTPLRGALLRRYVAAHRYATRAANGGRVRPCGDPAACAAYSPPGCAGRFPLASAGHAVKGRFGPCQSGFFSR